MVSKFWFFRVVIFFEVVVFVEVVVSYILVLESFRGRWDCDGNCGCGWFVVFYCIDLLVKDKVGGIV